MVGARTFAMAANRIIDRHIDARNPRTAGRELVTGAVSVRTAWTGAAVALVVFLAAAAAAQPALPGARAARRGARWSSTRTASGSPTGRTRSSALAQAVGPVGAWLAVTGTFAGSGPAWLLGAAVGLWIGGFDLIYACQDAEIDREIGVHSVPARYGLRFALHASTVAHVVTFALFIWFGALVGFGWLVVDRAGADRGRLRLPAHGGDARPTCPGSTGRSSPPTASSASRCSSSPCSTS